MRDIKFRTWDTENKEFSEWTNRDPFFSTSHGQIFFWEKTREEDGSYGGDIILEDLKDRFVLQQFTGLKDKNNKEIYEGDIVEVDLESGDKGITQVRYENAEFNVFPWGNLYWVTLGGITVIGNIFENPELLLDKELQRC
jgi:uncharacterized phage protein (TIGR01671 family)